ncbi:RNA-directed DNA polymerase [Streptomyces zinciresistens K42]|uniref:RNA-directed DNA polymerase n=1 Tax=Streptomyces zinciresistens K42 TaxID=700597 RepID=G2G5L5_9ACTN|nr:RNA-directed DNA polymerase [Streptomyces zinciresistens K42]
MRDRVAQQAAKIVLEPVFEAGFLPCSYGFRPKRSATQAMERLRVGFAKGSCFVVEFDIRNFFGGFRLREGRGGLDFLGCHFRARFSGRSWEKYDTVRFYLHRRPSQAAMKRLRDKVRVRTDRRRSGMDIRDVIAELNPILRGWGNYFRTGNAARKFRQVDNHVVWRLRRLMLEKRGRNLRGGQQNAWTEEWFVGHGLYCLRGTIRYPKTA